jgi:hypothetical protein
MRSFASLNVTDQKVLSSVSTGSVSCSGFHVAQLPLGYWAISQPSFDLYLP